MKHQVWPTVNGTVPDCPTNSRYRLPIKHLLRRLNKGPCKIGSAEMWEGEYSDMLFLQPAISGRYVSLSTKVEGDLLYSASTEALALTIERNFRRQVENTRKIIDQMQRRAMPHADTPATSSEGK